VTRTPFQRPGGVLCLLLLALTLGISGAGKPLGIPGGFEPTPLARDSTGNNSPTLVLDPGSWWTVAGNSTRLVATWVGIPAGCVGDPLWFRWSVTGGWDEGTLAPSDGPVDNFTTASVASGTAEISVAAATTIVCGTGETAVHRGASANVTVVVPPQVDGVTASPDPIVAGNLTNLSGTIWGGQPPYRVTVTWGDGNLSVVNLSTVGPFTLTHRYASGAFTPALSLEDSAGLFANTTAEEPVYSSSGIAVGVETASPVAEVGVPVSFTGTIVDPPTSFSRLETCSDSSSESSGPGGTGSNVSFSCTFSAPGTAEVDYQVFPVGDGQPPSEATLELPVVGALALEVTQNSEPVEVGRRSAVSVTIAGGVPPFGFQCQLSDNASDSVATVSEDGTVAIPVSPSEPGTFGLTVRVVDAAGSEVENGSLRLVAEAPLNASAAAVGTEDGVVRVSGAVPQGVAPFVWFVAPRVVPMNGTLANGTLLTVSTFSWDGTVPFEGSSSVIVGVADAVGAFWWESLAVTLAPPLAASVTLRSGVVNGTETLSLNLTIRGGVAPFNVWTNLSDGSSRNESVPADGTLSWWFVVNQSGRITVTTTVVDHWWLRAYANGTANVSVLPPPSSPTPPPTTPSPPPAVPGVASYLPGSTGLIVGAVALAIGLAAATAYLWRRRRHRADDGPGPDPVAVLREIIEPADGADRSTVELLAEERGVPLGTVRSTLDRLIGDGTVRAERGSDGEEVLAWSILDSP
jgi:hypothetical protein